MSTATAALADAKAATSTCTYRLWLPVMPVSAAEAAWEARLAEAGWRPLGGSPRIEPATDGGTWLVGSVTPT